MALTDLTRISTSGIATGTSLSGAILHGDAHFRGDQVGINSALFDSSENRLDFKDNVKLRFGDNGDLSIFHDGSDSRITNGGGLTYILGDVIRFRNHGDSGTVLNAALAGVDLYASTAVKLSTNASGVNVTGVLTATSFSGPIVGNTHNTAGLSTFYDLRVSNNLTVEGSTTTLDTNLIGVDRVEVGANSNTVVGVAITQSGTADILRLYDGTSQVLTVDDQGNVGLGATYIPSCPFDIEGRMKSTQYQLKKAGNAASIGAFFHLTNQGGDASSNDVTLTANNSTNSVILRAANEVALWTYNGGAYQERLTVMNNGKVGINTDVPATHLHLAGTDANLQIRVTKEGVGSFNHGVDSTGAFLETLSGDNIPIRFYAGGGERMRVTPTGRVGINTNSPDQELHVRGQIKVDDNDYARVEYARHDVNLWSAGLRDTDDFWFFRESGSSNIIIQHGKLGIGTVTPGATLDVQGGIQSKTNGASVRIESQPTTNFAQLQILNHGGNFYIGRENSAGNWFGTGTAYASVVRSDGTHPLIFRWNSADRLKIHNYSSVNFVEVDTGTHFSLANDGSNIRGILIGDGNASSTGGLRLQAGGGSSGFGGGIVMYSHANSTNAGGVYIGKSAGSTGSIILGNGGTAPSSTYLEIDDGGRVALGGLDASAYYSSYNQFVLGRTNDTGGMTIVSANNSTGYIAFADGTSGSAAYSGRMFYNHVDNDFRFNLDGQAYNSMRLHRTGALTNSFDAQSHYTRPLLEITTSATPTQLKITTNIPYSGVTHAHSVRISGFRYGGREMADIQIGWHVYANQFYNRIASSSGSWAPTITLAVESGKVVIHLTSPGYWPKMYVESMYQAYGDSAQAIGWTWADAAISADANTPNETVPYKSNFGNGVNIDMNGHLYVNNGNIVMGNDKGISFLNADDTATGETVSSSVLDDYEEGTFVATLKGHTDPSNTSSVNANKTTTTTGRYVKVGQSVTVTMRWYNLQNNGANEMHNCQLQNIHGLPYHSKSASTNWTASLGYQRGLYPRYNNSSVTSQAVWMYGYIEGNSDKVQLRASQSSGPGTLFPTVHDSTSHMYLTFTITYQSFA